MIGCPLENYPGHKNRDTPYALDFLGKLPIKNDRHGGRFRQGKASGLLLKVPGQVRRPIETVAGIARKGRNPRVEQFILIQPRFKTFLHSSSQRSVGAVQIVGTTARQQPKNEAAQMY